MQGITTLAALVVLGVGTLAATASAAAGSSAGNGSKQGTIVQTAAAAGQFKTLAMLLKRAGLVSSLQKPGPYTVFAPTDASFKKAPKSTLDALLADKAKLRAVLLYHVVPGKLTAARITRLSSVKTATGERRRIRVSGGNVFVNSAKVTKLDITASNGVIHVINRILVPSA
jgi:uncharacterized surface protein with fasciclin (FAS1) repeats